MAPAVAVKLDDSRAFEGLTTAQHKFIMLMFSGLSNREAYRAVFDTSQMADSTVAQKASELANLPMVTAKLRELRQRVEAQATLAPNLTREFVLNGVMGLALDADRDSVRLAAYQTLGKTVGIDLFRDVHVTEKITRTPEDVDKELKARLQELQRSLTIEGEARDVPPSSSKDVHARPADRRRKPRS